MTPEPKDREKSARGIGCLLSVVILVGALLAIRVVAATDDEPRAPVTPTSTTMAPDEAARSGCYWWRNYLRGGPFFGSDELSARLEYAVDRAQESAVWEVAQAARRYDEATTMQELDATSDALDRACATVGQ
jgi:hypothetical protein